MGLIDWLRALVGKPRQVRRNVSTIAATSGAAPAEQTEEIVQTEPQPMKPLHRRLTFRDARLLPKPKRKSGQFTWPRLKKKRYMQADEACRLFSTALRTRDRSIRDLATDKAQLSRYGLPVWHTEQDIAAALALTPKQLQHYSIHRCRETSPHYVAFAVPKRGGGHRIIHAPKRRLKAIQRKLNELLVEMLPISSYAHGFVKGRSIATNAKSHVGKAVVLKFDLKDCFPSIHFGRVRGLLIALGYGYPVAATLAVLMTEAPRQPVEVDGRLYHVPTGPRVCVQGAPTSPGLCNAVLVRMDRRLGGLARKYGFAYSRYADDLTFSGNDTAAVRPLLGIVPRIVQEEGFTINSGKTQIRRRGRRQRVTGVIVNECAGLSRRERRRLRAAIHNQQRHGAEGKSRRRLGGKLAYLKMLNPTQAGPLIAAFRSA
ncbi:MAG: RNA-directed DNA polymerase [Planctomycetes bacterium]|nr:RNA-directed DNA polymerase [Planctomycetota bacterium]